MKSLTQNKKIIYLALGVIILALLGFLAYRFLLAPGTERLTTTGSDITGGRLPDVTTGGGVTTPSGETSKSAEIETLKPGETAETAPEQILTRLTDYPVISPSLNKAENKILFYKKAGGDLLSLNFDGTEEEKVSNVTIVGLLEAVWASTKDRAGVFYLDGETLKGFLYLGDSGVSVLPQNIRGFSWSPDGKSLAYLLQKDFRLDLVVADSSGKNPRTVFSTQILDSHIKWTTSDKIVFQAAPSAFADGFIFVYSRSFGSFIKIVGPYRGLTSLWSPDGSMALITGYNRGGGLFSRVIDVSGGAIGEISFLTLPEKCSWLGNKKIYCAVPGDGIGRAVPDDYLRGEVNTVDRIIAYDLDKRSESTIFSEDVFDVSDLRVSKDEGYLFWVNRRDGTLWSLKSK